MTNERVTIPTDAEFNAARKAWSDAHAGKTPEAAADHAWIAGYARSFVDRRLSDETSDD